MNCRRFSAAWLGTATAFAWAQGTVRPEIHGVVLEPVTNHPVVEAEITVIKRATEGPVMFNPRNPQDLAGTATTDAHGTFRVGPEKFDEYQVEVKKEGFLATSTVVTLDSNHPRRELPFFLERPAEVSGRVIDDETGKPLPNIPVAVSPVRYQRGKRQASPTASAVTDDEGRFVAKSARPGDYVVLLSPHIVGKDQLLQRFSETDLKGVDAGYQETYWPGGGDIASALPVPVVSGTSVDIGTLKARKASYYRVHVTVPGATCPAGSMVHVTEVTSIGEIAAVVQLGDVPCGQDFLIRNMKIGSHGLSLSLPDQTAEERVRGIAAFEITDKNLDITVPLVRGVDVEGRIVAAEGASQPPLNPIQVSLNALPYGGAIRGSLPDGDGKFRLINVPLGLQRFSISGLGIRYYVKQLRYTGVPVSDSIFDLSGPGVLEVVVDDKPGTIEGSVADGDRPAANPSVVLVQWPASAGDLFRSVTRASGDDDGKFTFEGLAPGEYRILALSQQAKNRLDEPDVLERLLSRAEKVTVSPSGSQVLALKVANPSQ